MRENDDVRELWKTEERLPSSRGGISEGKLVAALYWLVCLEGGEGE